jgi:flavin reductase (DIM6/NTAB) family NADH-FMN oxidoreductase RutF
MLSPDVFRSVIGRFASGITIVTARDAEGNDHGMTATAFCSVSLVPPLVLVCIEHTATMHAVLEQTAHLCINFLSAEQEELSRRFGSGEPQRGGIAEEVRFDGVGYVRGVTGGLLLTDALAHLECRIDARHPAGDHTIIVAEVELATAHDARPLVYYRSGYTQLEH